MKKWFMNSQNSFVAGTLFGGILLASALLLAQYIKVYHEEVMLEKRHKGDMLEKHRKIVRLEEKLGLLNNPQYEAEEVLSKEEIDLIEWAEDENKSK